MSRDKLNSDKFPHTGIIVTYCILDQSPRKMSQDNLRTHENKCKMKVQESARKRDTPREFSTIF